MSPLEKVFNIFLPIILSYSKVDVEPNYVHSNDRDSIFGSKIKQSVSALLGGIKCRTFTSRLMYKKMFAQEKGFLLRIKDLGVQRH